MPASMPEVAGIPAAGPATRDAIKTHLGITDTTDDARLDAIVAGVNAAIRRWRVAQDAVGLGAWPSHITYGSTLLGARLFRRKNSPAGVESFGELGAAYVMRNDPDIAAMLRLGTWQTPGVG